MNQSKKKWLHATLALVVGGGTIFGLTNSIGPLPALASAFHPVKGVWTTAQPDQLLPSTEQIDLAGLEQSVHIAFERDGTPHIKADTNRDAFYAIGYVHAKYRLHQMDMMRRQGAGLLAEVVGPSAIESDKFQREVNLTRTAEAEWAQIKPGDELHGILSAYAEGVNAVIKEQTESGDLPMMFKIMGYEPTEWKPQDTLLLKGVLAQMMSLNTLPATYQLYVDAVGYERAMELMPLKPPGEQHPYDPGPYTKSPLRETPISAEQLFQQKEAPKTASADAASSQPAPDADVTDSVLSVTERLNNLHMYAIQENSNSNAWAVSGSKTASGHAMLAGDPHLEQTMPAIWYQMDVDAPDYKYSGVAVPGIPFALVGHNQDIAWTLTNGQNQQTFFYKEQTDEAHPNQYFWRGEWHDMETTTHEIPVKGGKTVSYEIKSSIHGPIVNRRGQTLALTWTGNLPSQGVQSLMNLTKAKNYDDFQSALKDWSAPIMNFVYADRAGNIGIIGAGTYPVFGENAKPWLPLSGTGSEDIVGAIPFEDIPQSYNPPSGVIGSGNQLQVGPDYPYYIGPTVQFDTGVRANRMYEVLEANSKLQPADFAKLQADVKDIVAEQIIPQLLKALPTSGLSKQEQDAVAKLRDWNYEMRADSPEASVWWTFWRHYMLATYEPWWEQYKFPVKEHSSLIIHPEHQALGQNLKVWTLKDPANKYFTNPITNEKRDANQLMVQAFRSSVAELQGKLGEDVSKWEWQLIHKRTIPSITQIPALGYAPKGAEGGAYTLNVAPTATSTLGPSWRMITDWATGQSVGVYPGGQSENPVSPWYQDRVDIWWNNEYKPMVSYDQTLAKPDSVSWTLVPKK